MFKTNEFITGGATLSPFKHLASRLNLAKTAEDDEDKKRDANADDDEDNKAKSKRADGDKDDSDSDDKDKKVSAEKDDKEDDDEGTEKDKKSKKSKSKASDDDKDDKKDDKEARAVERKRIRAIVDSPEAAESDDALHLALDLALNTDQDASICLVNLRAFNRAVRKAPKAENSSGARDALERRMAQSPKPDIGVDGDGGREPTLAEKIILAGKKRRGEI
jgi:hypothetical protein